MRRPAPPPPTDVVDLDYGSADPVAENQPQLSHDNKAADGPPVLTSANEVEASASTTHPANQLKSAIHGRRLPLPYDEDALVPDLTQSSGLYPQYANLNSSDGPESGELLEGVDASAVAGPSSLRRLQTSQYLNGTIAASDAAASVWKSGPRAHPLPPSFPPPALPQGEAQHRSCPHAYDPSVPEFRPSLPTSAQPTLHTESHPSYSDTAAEGLQHESYPHPASSTFAYQGQDLPYDPHAPYAAYTPFTYGAPQHYAPPYPPYPPSASYSAGYQPDPYSAYPGSHMTPQMDRLQQKRLLKQQKKQEKKQRKRENKRAAAAAAAASTPYHDSSSPATYADTESDPNSRWVEDGKPQALGMISELHARGVALSRLTEKGVPLDMIEACCAELNISAHGSTDPGSSGATLQHPAPSAKDTKQEKLVATTAAEEELLSKEEHGVALTPLEELRRKVLASRLAKAAATAAPASENAPPASEKTTDPATIPASNVFDRTATSGEADALLSQIGESIRSLIRVPPQEPTEAAASWDTPGAAVTQDPAPTSRKRSYRDVDAVDNEDASLTADLAGGELAAAPAPSRRQRISYADNFSRAAETPSGEVDLSAPVLDLPDFSEMLPKSPNLADTPARRRRPVAADFDTAEYRPQFERPSRFLDVPSGLNTVIDMSDDEMDEEELDAFEAARGWTEAQLDLDPREVLMLRQKTASEHYDNFCALNGLQPMRRADTPQYDGAKPVETGGDASAASASAARELLAQVAASVPSSAGSATPSREELLRKELEIKQLMRKIQMMEERKSKQQPSPSVSPMPSRVLQTPMAAMTNAKAELTNGTAAPVQASAALSAAAHAMPAISSAAAAPQTSANTPKQGQAQISSISASNLRLDPALQKQRENLLALLASKRKSAMAAASGSQQPGEAADPQQSASAVMASSPQQPSSNIERDLQPDSSNPILTVERTEVSLLPSRHRFSNLNCRHMLTTFFPMLCSATSPLLCQDIDRWCRVYSKA